MGRARHPKPYKDGRRQVTVPWKRRVLTKLDENKKTGRTPANREQLNNAVGAPKGVVNKLLDIDNDQMTNAYVDEICEVLQIAPPLIEEDDDDEEFVRDVIFLRTLSRDARRDLVQFAKSMAKRTV